LRVSVLSAGNNIKHRYFERHASTGSESWTDTTKFVLLSDCVLHFYRDDLRYNLGKTTVQECKKSSSVDLVDLCYLKNTDTAFGYDNMVSVSF